MTSSDDINTIGFTCPNRVLLHKFNFSQISCGSLKKEDARNDVKLSMKINLPMIE
jgi:hypothetical protein